MTTIRSWLLVGGGYLAAAIIPLLVMLQLASGYSSSFLGLWTPPNSERFRENVGIAAWVLMIASQLFCWAAFIRGSGAPRRLASVPAFAGLLLLLSLVFNKFVNLLG